MKVFYGATNIKAQSEDGTNSRLLNKAQLALYFKIKENEIEEVHIKKFIKIKYEEEI